MSKKARPTRRKRQEKLQPTNLPVTEFLRQRLTNPDPRSHAEFISDMRAKQAAGKLTNPAVTGPLIDRLERAIR